jgi:protein-disulfide isomerase
LTDERGAVIVECTMKKQYCLSIVGAALLALVVTPMAAAQESGSDLRSEIEQLKQGQKEIQQQLEEIKRLVQARPAAAPAGPNVKDKVFDLGENPVKGASTAKLTLVEFTDYQ